MPKAKPISLHPLNFDEAIKALMNVSAKPNRKAATYKRRKKKSSH